MHSARSTGPGQLARPAGTSKSSQRARTSKDPQYTIVGAGQQPWKQRHPHWGRELPALPESPRICICHTFLGACLFCVSSRYLGTPQLPVFSASPALVTARGLTTEDDTAGQTQVRYGAERYGTVQPVRHGYVDSRLSRIVRGKRPRSTTTSVKGQPALWLRTLYPTTSAITISCPHDGWCLWATDPRPPPSRQLAGISEAKQL